MRIGLVIVAALAALGSAAAAAAETSSTTVPVSGVIGNACTGESVLIEGSMHVLVHTTTDASGGVHTLLVANLKGVSGTGLSTGSSYRFVSVSAEPIMNVSLDGAQEATELVNARQVAPGAGNDVAVHANIHFTVDANGEVRAAFGNQTQECR